MSSSRLLSPSDIRGVWAIIPTPATPDGGCIDAANTVDLDETSRVVDALIESGVTGILSMGTLGECATLTWDEKKDFMGAMVETARTRVPIFVGTTSLNTRDTIAQTRFARDLGASGTMLGLPMWCAPSPETAVQFYRDVAQSVPDMNICVYANAEAFKFEFGTGFWAQVARIPQVVAAKYSGAASLVRDLRVIDGGLTLLPNEFEYYACARIDDGLRAFWSSGAACGPGPALKLHALVEEARRTGQWKDAAIFNGRMGATAASLFPEGSFKLFSTYNIALEKTRMNAAGWMNAGPVRPPYAAAPESYLEGARKSGTMWAELARGLDR